MGPGEEQKWQVLESEKNAQIIGRNGGAENTKCRYPDFIPRWENAEKDQSPENSYGGGHVLNRRQ